MITRAIVKGYNVQTRKIKVQIPWLNKIDGVPGATLFEDLYEASLPYFPGMDFVPEVGDAIYLGFEDNQENKPVLLGYVKDPQTGNFFKTEFNKLTVTDSAVLPRDTKIGNVTPEQISFLEGVRSNIQQQIDNIGEGGGSGTTDYSQLINKPSINGVTLVGNKTSSDLHIGTGAHAVTYGLTPYSTINTYFNNKEAAICNLNDQVYQLMFKNQNEEFWFVATNMNSLNYLYVGKNNNWGQGYADLEFKYNKVTTITEESTNNQYPSAKATYDLLGSGIARFG